MQFIPKTRDLVLIGGGHAHALVLRAWGMRPLAGARLTLVNPGPVAPYTGMLPGFVAGHYNRGELDIDLVRLARHAGARIIFDWAVGLDRSAGQVLLADRPPVAYDIASVNIGISTGLPDLPGFAEHGVAAKPMDVFADRWEMWRASAPTDAPVAILGGGVAGVELALAAAWRMRRDGRTGQVTVIEAGPDILARLSAPARSKLTAALEDAGIACLTGVRPTSVTAEAVLLDDGRSVPSHFVIGAAGARTAGWLETTGLALTDGAITVGPTLASVTDPAVFAAGDTAHMANNPREKAGVFAVRQAPILTHNLRAALGVGTPKPFQPQSDYLKLISLGDKAALADKWDRGIAGRWLWRLKDRIDRKFMTRLSDLPAMETPPIPAETATGVAELLSGVPPCAGCGSKVGPDALNAALASVPSPARADVLTGRGDDAAVLSIGGSRQVLSTDHFRAFWDDPYLFVRIATVHALGDIWAMGAAPQAVLVSATLPRMTPQMQAATLSEMMAGVASVTEPLGADIVGGHSATGAEMAIGLTATGLVEGAVRGLDGAQVGDCVVLTKPIGSGTILSGAMRGLAPGGDVRAALAIMGEPSGGAAAVLAPVANAMTDVTGFGLAGHAAAMASASGVTIRLDVPAVPLMAGAEALTTAGVRSSLWPENASVLDRVDGWQATARHDLLLDPQTAGGLLAALPEAGVQEVLDALDGAVLIGRVEERASTGVALIVG